MAGGTTLFFDAALTNAGTFDVLSTGITELEAGGTSTGSIVVSSGATLDFGAISSGFNSGTATASYTISSGYSSSGVTEVDPGATVSFSSGTAINLSSGTWQIGSRNPTVDPNPATLDLSNASLSGNLNNLYSPGTLLLGGYAVTIDGFNLSGTLSDSATVTLIGVPGDAQLGGTLTGGGGSVVLSSGQSYAIASVLTLADSETLDNAGSLSVSSGGGITGTTGIIDNANGATLNFTGSSVALDVANLANAGLIGVASGSTATVTAAITNTATGTITVTSGGTLDLSNSTFGNALENVTVAGTLVLGAKAVTIDGFNLSGTLSDSNTVTLYGGTLGGSLTGGGTVVLASSQSYSMGSALTLAAGETGETLENYGSLSVATGGITTATSSTGTLVNESHATLAFGSGFTSVGVTNFTNRVTASSRRRPDRPSFSPVLSPTTAR